MLLGLARLDDDFNRVLQASRLRAKLERELGFPLREVFLPAALPAPPTELLELWVVRHDAAVNHCAFSPDGRLLATPGDDGTARLWDLASGTLRATFRGHEGSVWRCVFSPDGRLLATAGLDGTARIWDLAAGSERAVLRSHEGPVWRCVFGPDGLLVATASDDGTARLWEVASGKEIATLRGHTAPVFRCAFSPDGRLLATASLDRTARLWDLATRTERVTLRGHDGPVLRCGFSPDGRLLATASDDRTARLWELPSGDERATLRGHEGGVLCCAFSPDRPLLATGGDDGTARLWELDSGYERATLHGHERPVLHCVFSPDGRQLATTSDDRTTRLWDVASAAERTVLRGHQGTVFYCAFSRDGGLLASASADGTSRVWEEVEAPLLLPAVVPDAVGGADRLGIGKDAAALANVIAAKETSPPLSIGLFGDWGSGKSFLIGEVKERIRRIARRARASESSAYCAYVRNVEFNAWHYADANLWASLVTHIFDELAKPEPAAGVSDERTAQAQVARLEEELAAQSGLRDRLVRAHEHRRRAEARKRLLKLTWRLAGAKDEDELEQLRNDLASVRGTFQLLLPSMWARIAVLGLAAAVAAGAGVLLAVLGTGRAVVLASAVGIWVTSALGWVALGRSYLSRLLKKAGETARVVDVRDTSIDAEVEAARAAEDDLRRQLGDLRSGRRLARFAAERGATEDYRSHLGLVSRIHEDFERMSEILARQSASAGTDGGAERSDLPRIDRIVLYIDDLDRCPPRRVVEVLEAVHLILAVPLFVVVIAVDPRWLVLSLRLHYSELLADDDSAPRGPADEATWRSTPVHYLEKIIQVPFALRPMGPQGVESLVRGLLPVEVAAEEVEPARTDGASPPGSSSSADAERPVPASEARPRSAPEPAPPAPRAPSLSPRTLALTEAERTFAVKAASALRTPRTVKKFTNLYRILRAGLDEHTGELDRFLAEEPGEAPEYQAVLMLIALIIAFPEEASAVLLELGDLASAAPRASHPWAEFVQSVNERGGSFEGVARFLEQLTSESATSWTTEPFCRWGLEVSRYSFATGQEVFSSIA